MGNMYRAVSDLGAHLYGEGGELELTAVEEKDALDGKHLELVPRKYRVLSNNYAAGKQGDEVSLALLVEHEASVLGVHIERVDKPDTNQKKKG